jgi:hypothetical protein
MHPPCSSYGTSIQARRRQTETLRDLTVEDAALLETIAWGTRKFPAEQDERVALPGATTLSTKIDTGSSGTMPQTAARRNGWRPRLSDQA